MIEQVCNLETVQPQEIPIKVCVAFYNTEIYRGCGKKQVFLQSFNILKCMVVSYQWWRGCLVCYFTVSGINQYAAPKTLKDVFGASLS